jgi:thiamine-monophosphate kinase
MMREKKMQIRDIGEFPLIERLAETLGHAARGAGYGVICGIGDDAAVLQMTPGYRLLATCDMLVEGVHFDWNYFTPQQLGWKALAVNLSDIAAMGARPRWALVSLGLPPDTLLPRVEGVYHGISQLADRFGVTLVGGDTTSSPAGTVINITVLGEAPRSRIAYRSGAREGDWLLVTGELGGSAAGLACFQEGGEPVGEEEVTRAYLTPWPRVREAAVLMNSGLVGALNDISDGLASETAEIASASGLGAVIMEERIPISSSVRRIAGHLGYDPLRWALFGGEDFELLLTIPGGKGAPLQARRLARSLKKATGTPLTIVGRMLPAGEGIKLEKKDGTVQELSERGYNHFRGS